MDKSKIDLLKAALGSERVKTDESLTFHTHLKLDITAQCFYIATNQLEFQNAVKTAVELKIKFLVFGGGSKLFIKGKAFDGLAIKNRTGAVKVSGVKGKVGRDGIGIEEAMVEADSGVSLNKLNDFLAEQGLRKIECNSVLFGTIGGSIFSDPDIKNLAQKIKVLEKGQLVDKENYEIFQKNDVILSVVFKIKAQER